MLSVEEMVWENNEMRARDIIEISTTIRSLVVLKMFYFANLY